MRLYAIFCFIAALFYCATALQAMNTGTVAPMRGDTTVLHRRDDPASNYQKLLFARWLLCGGLTAMGVLMHVLAGKFEKLEDAKPK